MKRHRDSHEFKATVVKMANSSTLCDDCKECIPASRLNRVLHRREDGHEGGQGRGGCYCADRIAEPVPSTELSTGSVERLLRLTASASQ